MPVTEELNNHWTENSQRMILSPSLFAKNNLFYAQELGYFETLPAYFAARSHLNSYLIVYTLRGTGELHYRSETVRIHPNELFFIDCMNPHRYTCISENWDFLWLHLNGSSTAGYQAQFAENNPHCVMTVSNGPKVESMMRELLGLNTTPSQYNELLSSRLIMNLLTELLLQNFKAYTRPQQSPEFLEKVMADIDKNFAEDLRLDELAKKYNVDMFYLSKSFKSFYSINLKEYILNRRITKAKDLLAHSQLSVAEIAQTVGFGSASHFISLFKARENLTPLMYRNLWKS